VVINNDFIVFQVYLSSGIGINFDIGQDTAFPILLPGL
jgi:hypothetical protein